MNPATARSLVSLSGCDPAGYRPHALHGQPRAYPETNCYTDMLIELLHARGYEPLAALGHLVRVDFEGDQWTFFKPPPDDLEALYGIDIHEMQPYRSLPLQIAEQIARDRTIIVELDAFFLPDTAGASYRTEHVKTSIAADAIDAEGEILRYFHNAGLHELSGPDYRGALSVDEARALPPYTELVRFDAGPSLEGERLRDAARRLLRRHLAKRPPDNPFDRFGASLVEALPQLRAWREEDYHAYAFATVRMAGAAFELAGSHARWLLADEAAAAAAAMDEIADGCKALSFRLARRRPFDVEPLIAPLADAWARALDGLLRAAG